MNPMLLRLAPSVLALLAAPAAAQSSVFFSFDNAPLYRSLPLDVVAGGITAHLAATGQGFSIQSANSAPVRPIGFSGNMIYPNSVFPADLIITFSQVLTSFSIQYSPQELGCDDSARMRVTAYRGPAVVGTNTTTARFPGTWPVETLSCAFPQGFDKVIVHYDARPPRCSDWGPIFICDNMNVGYALPAAFLPYGAGCAGGAGTPALAAQGASLPWIGTTFTAQLTNLGADAQRNLPFVLAGDSRTTWGPLPLPLDLAPYGMTGCTLHANPLLSFVLPNAGGTATWSVGVPNTPALVGQTLFVQGGVTSPGANAAGLVWSNACELRIGAQ
jgi:hypothetical protein